MASEKSKYFSIFGKRPASTENDDERKKKQKQYEQAKRSRSYQEEWSKKFPWHRKIRREDGVEVLICEPCKNQAKKRGNQAFAQGKDNYITGSTIFRSYSLSRHECTDSHKTNVKKEKKKFGTQIEYQYLFKHIRC